MRIYYEKKDGKPGIIYSGSIPLVDLPGRITDELEIGNGCNLFNLLMEVPKIEIKATRGSEYIACVKERKYIEIYYRSKKVLKIAKTFMMRMLVFDGDKEDPETFENVVKMAITNAWKSLDIISEREKIISSRP